MASGRSSITVRSGWFCSAFVEPEPSAVGGFQPSSLAGSGGSGFLLWVLGFARAIRDSVAAQQAQLLEAARQLPPLLGLVAADGVEALEVEGGQRVGHLPLEADLRRAQLGGDIEQRDLDPLGALALPERDRHALHQPRLDFALGLNFGHQARRKFLQLGRGFVLEDEILQRGEAVLEGVAGAAGFAFGGDRAARAGAVAAGRLDLGGRAGTWGGGGHGGRPVGGLPEHSTDRRIFLDGRPERSQYMRGRIVPGAINDPLPVRGR